MDTYYEKSRKNSTFTELYEDIFSLENISLAYNLCKENLSYDFTGYNDLYENITSKLKNYKPNRPVIAGKYWTWDALDYIIQQAIKNILDPIIKGQYSNSNFSYIGGVGTEQVIATCAKLVNLSKTYYATHVDFSKSSKEMKHGHIIRSLWSRGIQDKRVISLIRKILNSIGTEGIPLYCPIGNFIENIYFMDLDDWVDSQWVDIPTNRIRNKRGKYQNLRMSACLKEMYLVRFGAECVIFTKKREDNYKIKYAVEDFVAKRLNIDTYLIENVDLRSKYGTFFGFKMRCRKKRNSFVLDTYINDEAVENYIKQFKYIIKEIKKRPKMVKNYEAWNGLVRELHSHWCIATQVQKSCEDIKTKLDKMFYNRLMKTGIVSKTGSISKNSRDYKIYATSSQTRFSNEIPRAYLLPIAYIKTKNPMCKKRYCFLYSNEERDYFEQKFKSKRVDILLAKLDVYSVSERDILLTINKNNLIVSQDGKDAITKEYFDITDIRDIELHHIIPKYLGGSDDIDNLILIKNRTHKLIHSSKEETISKYIEDVDTESLKIINKYRKLADNKPLSY